MLRDAAKDQQWGLHLCDRSGWIGGFKGLRPVKWPTDVYSAGAEITLQLLVVVFDGFS